MTESLVMCFSAFFCNELEIKIYLSCMTYFWFSHSRKYLNYFSDIIREWGIPKDVIGKVLTDNGSNMLKALQLFAKDIFVIPASSMPVEHVFQRQDIVCKVKEIDLVDQVCVF